MEIVADDLCLTFRHQFYYSSEKPIPAADVAEAILALNRIIHRAPKVMKGIVPEMSLPKAQLFVERLESGSLTEDIIIKLAFGSKKQMNRTLAKWKKNLGIDLTTNKGVLRTIIIALILTGGFYAASRFLEKPQRAAVEISGNTIINIGTQELKLSAEDLVKIIEAAVSNKKQLAQDAVATIKPAKYDHKAEIFVDGRDGPLKITAEEVSKIPVEVAVDKEELSTKHEHVEIHVRANDLDNTEHGWAAVIPAISPQRVKLELAPAIKPDQLYGKKIIRGSVEEIRSSDNRGRMQLRCYRLEAIDDQ
ncbi:MAG: hypothetical protein KIT44_02745 [Opitutaceae bacterium]|nr:hypothetical protein [Opitutaceae bacterium]